MSDCFLELPKLRFPFRWKRYAFTIGLIAILCCFAMIRKSYGQFIYLSMEVETETSTSTIQELDFGSYNPAEKIGRVKLGSPDMGILMIRGLEYQNVMLDIDKPEYLTHQNPTVNDRIPVTLHAAYNNNSRNNSKNAHIINGSKAYFTLYNSPDETRGKNRNFSQGWAQTYIYFYGSINLENAQSGIYSNTVTLTIEY